MLLGFIQPGVQTCSHVQCVQIIPTHGRARGMFPADFVVEALGDPRPIGQGGAAALALDVFIDSASVGKLLPGSKPFYKRLMPRLSFKGNLAAVMFSLIGQHYYLTLRHSVKRGQIEGSVRAYTEKYLRQWSEKQGGFRAKLFKPFQPTLERWGRSLQKKAAAEKKKKGLA